MLNFLKKIFKSSDGSYYPKKCTKTNHYGKIKTPTLSRTVISVDAPCQCGHYKGHKDFMSKQHEKFEEVMQKIKEEESE